MAPAHQPPLLLPTKIQEKCEWTPTEDGTRTVEINYVQEIGGDIIYHKLI